MPTFLVLGAEKAGTTALHRLLRKHPKVYVAPKEPEFFSFEWNNIRGRDVTTLEGYQALFQGVTNKIALGDVSTTYLPSPSAAEKIKQYIPNARLVAILRHPAERAFSRYWMSVKYYPERLPYSPDKFLFFFHNQTYNPPWADIRSRGFYYKHLKRYYDLFPVGQIRVFLYEEFKKDSKKFLSQLLEFIGVDSTFIPKNQHFATSGQVRSQFVNRIIKAKLNSIIKRYIPHNLIARGSSLKACMDKLNTISPPKLDIQTRKQLVDYYRDDILKLQDLLDQDLSHWLQ